MSDLTDEALFERRRSFLTQRIAGGTFRAIAERYNAKAVQDAVSVGMPADEAETVSPTTVRKDVEAAKAEIIDDATRDALRGEHRAILLDMRRANYPAMASGDVDAARVVMSTLVREAEMFGLDDPKRSVIGVGTNVEFASDLVALIEGIGYQAPSDLVFAARGERDDRAALTSRDETVVDAEIIPFDLTSPEPRAAVWGGVAHDGRRPALDGRRAAAGWGFA